MEVRGHDNMGTSLSLFYKETEAQGSQGLASFSQRRPESGLEPYLSLSPGAQP